MLDPSEPLHCDQNIWEFALVWYAQPGVQSDCLAAQDEFGLDVTALILALHRAAHNKGFDASMAAELARTLSSRVIEPLRSARIALKSMPRWVDPKNSAILRDKVMSAELDGERMTLDALAALPDHGVVLTGEQALLAIVQARQISADSKLVSLLKRLALAVQNM